MSDGQKVICISEDFPLIEKYSTEGSKPTSIHPKKGEVLTVDEVLGAFLRFDKYDTPNQCNWWHHTRFAPIDENKIDESVSELLQNIKPHEVGKMDCLICNNQWIAVRPLGTTELQCPNCGQMSDVNLNTKSNEPT